MGSECGPGGSQTRAVWCAHPEGWLTRPANCPASHHPGNQRGCFHVCDRHRELYDWRRGDWGPCLPVPRGNGDGGGAGGGVGGACARGAEGIQRREAGCVRTADGSPAEDDAICEYFEPKPRLEQACLIPCPRDCVASAWGAWAPCPAPCRGAGAGLQSRVRAVLAPPLFGGGACPALAEFRPCDWSAGGECRDGEAGLRVGPWSTCQAPPTPSAGPAPSPPPRQARQARRRKNRERGRERGRGAARDPETRELIQKKRTRNRQNRPDAQLWDLQLGLQTRQLRCTHRNATPAPLRSAPPARRTANQPVNQPVS